MEEQQTVALLNDAKLAWHLGIKDGKPFIETPCSSQAVMQALRTLKVPADIVLALDDVSDDGNNVHTFKSFKIMVQGEDQLIALRDKGVVFPGSDLVGKASEGNNLTDDMRQLIEAQGGQTAWVARVQDNNPAPQPPVRPLRLI